MSKKKGKRKQGRSARQQSYARLKRRVRQGPLGDQKIIVEPKGQVKMSEVLEDFVEPYRDEIDDTLEVQRKLLSVAVLAWNAALLPEKERREMVDDVVKTVLKKASAEEKQDFWDMVGEMIERKLAHFSGYKRTIIDFDLVDTGRGFHLTVISTMGES